MSSSIKERRREVENTQFTSDLSTYMRNGLWEQCPWIQQVSLRRNGDYVVEFADPDSVLHTISIRKGYVSDGPRKGDSVILTIPVGSVDTDSLPEYRREKIQGIFDLLPSGTCRIDTVLTAPKKLPEDAYMHVMGHMKLGDQLEIFIQSELSPIDRRTFSAVGRQLAHIRGLFPNILAHARGTFSTSFEPNMHM